MNTSRKTRWALLISGLLNEPIVGLLGMLPFILRKDLGATALQLSLFSMLKPAMALFSFYWGATLWRNRERLRANWIGAHLLQRLPFIVFPFVQNVWFFIVAATLFLFFQRGAMPAQMEILKQNVEKGTRESFFSWSSAINFFAGALLGLSLGTLLNDQSWKLIFFCSGILGLLSLFLQMRVPIQVEPKTFEPKNNPILTPWKDSWNLLKERPDFARFQLGFMLGGIGLMLIMPALWIYAVDLGITYSQMTLSRFVWMGLGFVLATPLWRRKMGFQGIFQQMSVVCLLFAFAGLAWILASFQLSFFFIAYFFYGIAQAGSHLIWSFSGPLFAGEKDSSLYSTVNVLTVGLRGLVVPFLSGLLCDQIGPLPVLGMGIVSCLAGSVYLLTQRQQVAKQEV